MIDEQLRSYLQEGNMPHFTLADPAVQSSVKQVWNNPRPFTTESPLYRATVSDIERAYELLNDVTFLDGSRFVPSRMARSAALGKALGLELYVLSDTRRETGSFKERGAIVEVLRAARGGAVHAVTASHGNHGLAVALAAQKMGLRSTIVVPDTTPKVKIARLQSLGAIVVTTGEEPWRGYEEARDWGLRYTFERNHFLNESFGIANSLHYVHGFEDVIPGQGVLGMELYHNILTLPAEMPKRFREATFLFPLGGGGLAAGAVTALRGRFPAARMIGVASDQAPALHHSLITDLRSEVFLNENGLCDSGIGLTIPGAKPFEVLREVLHGSLVVSDAEVGEAMRLIHRHQAEVVEGGAATGIAAILSRRLPELGVDPKKPIVTVFSGGNIDAFRHEAVMSGREAPYPGGILESKAP